MAAASFRTYLRDTIVVTDAPGRHPSARRVAIQDEGLETIEDLSTLTMRKSRHYASRLENQEGRLLILMTMRGLFRIPALKFRPFVKND